MKESGFDLTFGSDNLKCATLTTGLGPDGRFDFYIHLFGGSGVSRHLHGYAEEIIDYVLINRGGLLKDNQYSHCGPGIVLNHTTQEVAQFRVEKVAGGI